MKLVIQGPDSAGVTWNDFAWFWISFRRVSGQLWLFVVAGFRRVWAGLDWFGLLFLCVLAGFGGSSAGFEFCFVLVWFVFESIGWFSAGFGLLWACFGLVLVGWLWLVWAVFIVVVG